MLCYVASGEANIGGAFHPEIDRATFLTLLIDDVDNLLFELKNQKLTPDNVAHLTHMLQDKGAMQTLESFLAGAPRPFDDSGWLHDGSECSKLESVLRISALQVLEFLFVTAVGVFGQSALVETYKPLLTVVCLLDIASLYYSRGSDNTCEIILNNMLDLGRPWLQENLSRSAVDISENLSMVTMVVLDSISDLQWEHASNDIRDGLQYLRDATFTLCALLGSCKDTRYLFMKNGFHVVQALGLIFDVLIPKLYFYLEQSLTKSVRDELTQKSCELECATGKAVDLLFDGLLQHRDEDEGMAGGSSGVSEVSILLGEFLIESLCSLNGRDESDSRAGLGLVKKLTQTCDFPGRIQKALEHGIIFLDDAQKQYVMDILGISNLEAPTKNNETEYLNQNDQLGPKDMLLLKNISQVEEILPGSYGAGFLALCLQELNNSPADVVDALLTGNIPQTLEIYSKDLDWQDYLDVKEKRGHSEGHNSITNPEKAAFPELPKKKSKGQEVTSKFLDTLESTYKDRLKNSVISTQWEYEDEYDDSYDEQIKVAGESNQATEVLEIPRDYPAHDTSRPKKTWVLDGKVYNYRKAGAQECSSQQEVDRILAEQRLSKLEIHGLGPGGNKKNSVENTSGQTTQDASAAMTKGNGKRYSFKEKNKGRIGNHNRKDRATHKQTKGMS